MRRILALLAGCLAFLGAAGAAPVAVGDPAQRVTQVPADVRSRLGLKTFYRKYVGLRGFPVVASAKASDHALLEAAWIIERMLAGRPALLEALVRSRVRCCVMAHDELTTDVPEHSDLAPARYWDRRARGLGASPQRPCVSCAEENLLSFRGDPYPTENILVHEFAHAIDHMALRRLDATFEERLTATYAAALKAGLWKNTYASRNKEEYWAEGVQSWFDTNRPPDALHNHVDTREELEAYDPRLARLIAKELGKNPWRYRLPAARTERRHLTNYDPSKAPRFAWPPALDDWYRKYMADRETGAGRADLEAQAPRVGLRSLGTTEKSQVLFINKTAGYVRIFWIDFEGKRRAYGGVGPGLVSDLPSYRGHAWVVVDEKNVDLAVFVAAARPGRAIIR